jgi:hypothetical protein
MQAPPHIGIFCASCQECSWTSSGRKVVLCIGGFRVVALGTFLLFVTAHHRQQECEVNQSQRRPGGFKPALPNRQGELTGFWWRASPTLLDHNNTYLEFQIYKLWGWLSSGLCVKNSSEITQFPVDYRGVAVFAGNFV